jgi:hypothetical protein
LHNRFHLYTNYTKLLSSKVYDTTPPKAKKKRQISQEVKRRKKEDKRNNLIIKPPRCFDSPAVIPAPDALGCANAANTRMCMNSASRNPEVLELNLTLQPYLKLLTFLCAPL